MQLAQTHAYILPPNTTLHFHVRKSLQQFKVFSIPITYNSVLKDASCKFHLRPAKRFLPEFWSDDINSMGEFLRQADARSLY